MTKLCIVLCLGCVVAHGAEARKLTLKQAVELALKQSPELALARLDERRAQLGVTVVREPLLPRVYAGSGLAYSNGFPMSIDGASPSIVQAKAVRTLYSRPQDYSVAAARENAHGATIAAEGARDEVAYKTALAFLDLEQVVREQAPAARERESLARAAELVRLRVNEGREREIEARRAELVAARAKQRESQLARERERLSAQLASVLGLDATARIEPALEQRDAMTLPTDAQSATELALKDNAELRKIESAISAKQFEARGFRAMRLPKIDLVAQYGLFAKFNNYTDYFRTFQRNNGQIGFSVSVPVFANAQDEAQAAQSDIEVTRLRTQLAQTRTRVDNAVRQAWAGVDDAASIEELAKLELELAREQRDVALAQMEEGKLTLKDVELARATFEQRTAQLEEARLASERARIELLRQTRTLVAALR